MPTRCTNLTTRRKISTCTCSSSIRLLVRRHTEKDGGIRKMFKGHLRSKWVCSQDTITDGLGHHPTRSLLYNTVPGRNNVRPRLSSSSRFSWQWGDDDPTVEQATVYRHGIGKMLLIGRMSAPLMLLHSSMAEGVRESSEPLYDGHNDRKRGTHHRGSSYKIGISRASLKWWLTLLTTTRTLMAKLFSEILSFWLKH